MLLILFPPDSSELRFHSNQLEPFREINLYCYFAKHINTLYGHNANGICNIVEHVVYIVATGI
jgi:recombinational DNA repair ATPase RecF